ncbi:hypothetical protein AB0M19_34795 [Streptomyces sp. NPDC051920]|uniref:hypothetical protein n=1 Tax=Streptomyces sp. NPDC051920 TaxID=3155523 RepID=UPI00341C048C
MDSSVLAALISTPVALLAAAAAYAAGRVQGRGAYQGPIAAVRRQHQRDAYAAFLAAANAHVQQTAWQACFDEARLAIGITAFMDDSREEVERRATQIRARVPLDSLRAAAAVVFLEGPKRIAGLAQDIVHNAESVRSDARAGNGPGGVLHALRQGRAADLDPPAHYRLIQAVDAFTSAARDHLNGSGEEAV